MMSVCPSCNHWQSTARNVQHGRVVLILASLDANIHILHYSKLKPDLGNPIILYVTGVPTESFDGISIVIPA